MADTDRQSRAEAQQKLVQRANQDEAFRALLLSDPKEAIRQELELSLPPNVRVTVIEETPSEQYLVLPLRRQARDDGELSDIELERVAGGGVGCVPCFG